MTGEQNEQGETLMFQVEYRLERSRNKGADWSRLCHTRIFTSLQEVEEAFDEEHKNHPSDWLRIVKVEQSVVKEIKNEPK